MCKKTGWNWPEVVKFLFMLLTLYSFISFVVLISIVPPNIVPYLALTAASSYVGGMLAFMYIVDLCFKYKKKSSA